MHCPLYKLRNPDCCQGPLKGKATLKDHEDSNIRGSAQRWFYKEHNVSKTGTVSVLGGKKAMYLLCWVKERDWGLESEVVANGSNKVGSSYSVTSGRKHIPFPKLHVIWNSGQYLKLKNQYS